MKRKKIGAKKTATRSAVFHALAGSGHSAKPTVISYPSPNHAARQGEVIQTLVLHNTDGTLKSALARLTNPAEQVSAHYVVDRNGDIYQLVDDTETAWHSGDKKVNQQSIGIEIVAWKAATGFGANQEAAVIALAKFVLSAYSVALTSVIPHRKVKATDCPGWVWPKDADLEKWKADQLS